MGTGRTTFPIRVIDAGRERGPRQPSCGSADPSLRTRFRPRCDDWNGSTPGARYGRPPAEPARELRRDLVEKRESRAPSCGGRARGSWSAWREPPHPAPEVRPVRLMTRSGPAIASAAGRSAVRRAIWSARRVLGSRHRAPPLPPWRRRVHPDVRGCAARHHIPSRVVALGRRSPVSRSLGDQSFPAARAQHSPAVDDSIAFNSPPCHLPDLGSSSPQLRLARSPKRGRQRPSRSVSSYPDGPRVVDRRLVSSNLTLIVSFRRLTCKTCEGTCSG